ncbi:MAG: recombinase family protein [Parabacteroides sp.]|nr:recombinase family protein [Parabacteroides sp.]
MSNRAVIYCRVSTEMEIQENSLEIQINQAKDVVTDKGWTLVDEYIDFGKSGTTTENRIQYKRLVRNMPKDFFDIIVVKSQDRLMRSTKEWYLFIDTLMKYNIKLYFYLENTFYEPDDALLTGVKAILAEEFSRELSKKINSAHKRRQTNGKIMLCSRTYGYRNNNGVIEVDEKEAEMIREIFKLRAEGFGGTTIAKFLTAKGYCSRNGTAIGQSTINKIIRNTIYYGTMTMNKKHYDFETKKMYYNDSVDWIVRENALPAIVDYDLWKKANDQADIRSKQFKQDVSSKKNRGRKPVDDPLGGKIFCGICGSVYCRNLRKRVYDKILYWRCREYIYFGRNDTSKAELMRQIDPNYNRGCNNIQISNNDIIKVLLLIFEEKPEINADVMEQTRIITSKVYTEFIAYQKQQLDKKMKYINQQEEILLDNFLSGNINKADFRKKESELLNEKNSLHEKYLFNLEDKLLEMQINSGKYKDTISRFINEEFAESFMKEHIEKIIVYPERLHFYFDCFPNVQVRIDSSNFLHKSFELIDPIGHID